MRHVLGWMCWQIVMRWPGAWPSGPVVGWILAWAGDYANETPNVEVQRPDASGAKRRLWPVRWNAPLGTVTRNTFPERIEQGAEANKTCNAAAQNVPEVPRTTPTPDEAACSDEARNCQR